MACTLVEEDFEQSANDDGKAITYVRTFLVHFDTNGERGAQALVADDGTTSIPQDGDVYQAGDEIDYFAFANKRSAKFKSRLLPSGSVWSVTIDYSTQSDDKKNPLEADLEVTYGSQQFTRQVDKDRNDEALLNSARDAFNPSVEKEDSRDTLTFLRNESFYDPFLARMFKGKINLDNFYGYQPGTCKVFDITAQPQKFSDGTKYYKVTYIVHVNLDGFQPKLLDQGYRYLNDDDEQVHITVENDKGQKTQVTSPKLLDGEGGILADGGDPFFIDADIYEEVAFAGMNL